MVGKHADIRDPHWLHTEAMTGDLREAICAILIVGSCVCKALHRACKALRRGVFTELSAELNIVRLVKYTATVLHVIQHTRF